MAFLSPAQITVQVTNEMVARFGHVVCDTLMLCLQGVSMQKSGQDRTGHPTYWGSPCTTQIQGWVWNLIHPGVREGGAAEGDKDGHILVGDQSRRFAEGTFWSATLQLGSDAQF